ncbi:unnamed protein product, partial [Prorocentrum cordatum]
AGEPVLPALSGEHLTRTGLMSAGGGGGPPDDWDSRAALAAQRAAERGAQLAAAHAANLSQCHAALDEVQVALANLSAELADLRALQAAPPELPEEPDTLLWHALGVVLTAALTHLFLSDGTAAEAEEFFNELVPGRVVCFYYEEDMIDLFRDARLAARNAGLRESEPTAFMRDGGRPTKSMTVSFNDVPGFLRRTRGKGPSAAAPRGPPRGPPVAPPPLDAAGAEPGALADGEVGGTPTPRGGPGAVVLADERAAPPGSAWFVMKTIPDECQQFDEVVPKAGDVVWGESGLYSTAGGFVVPIELHPVPLPVEVLDKLADDDARLLGPLQRTWEGRRHRDFREAVSSMRQEQHDDFPPVGERSFKRLCDYIVDHGGTPDGRHTKWMMDSGCTKDSAAAHIHDLVGFAIEMAVTYDQVDGSNLASMEVVSRAYQLIEETMGSMKIEGVEHYIGRQKQSARRGVAMAPGVAKYATDQLAKETDIQKQRRKAREEKSAQSGRKEACSELLGRPCLHYDTANDLPLRPYAPHLASWPELGNEPQWLADRLGTSERCSLLDLDHALLLPPPSFDEAVETEGGPTLYMDPVMERNRPLYLEFIQSGISRGVFVLGKERTEDVSAFFVAKKDERIRMVLDCRRSNQRFQPPPSVSLFSAAGFADLEVPKDTPLYCAGVDVQNAFYQHKLPAYLRSYFCLPKVTAGELGISRLDGRRVPPWACLYPQLAVVPMGWSWALFFVQKAHERTLGAHPLVYVDNVLVAGTDREAVTKVRREASKALEGSGPAVHDETDAAESMTMLGGQLQGSPARATLAPRRFWKLCMGLGYLVQRRPRVTSRDVEHVIGHCTFAALCRRESLSCFSAVYSFVQQNYQRAMPLWASARREFRIFRGLLVTLVSDLDAEWSTKVVMTDACETGHASVEGEWDLSEVQSAGRWHERWRFRHTREADGGWRPRDRAARAAEVAELDAHPSVLLRQGLANKRSPEVSTHTIRRTSWSTMHYSPLFGKEPMHRKEARGDLHAVKLILSDADSWGKRHLVLGDNLALTLALSKGRCRDIFLLNILRRGAALTLASGARMHRRWVPSEFNAADGDSRSREGAAGRAASGAGWRATAARGRQLRHRRGSARGPEGDSRLGSGWPAAPAGPPGLGRLAGEAEALHLFCKDPCGRRKSAPPPAAARPLRPRGLAAPPPTRRLKRSAPGSGPTAQAPLRPSAARTPARRSSGRPLGSPALRRREALIRRPSVVLAAPRSIPLRELPRSVQRRLDAGEQARDTTRQLSITEAAAVGRRSRLQYTRLLELFLSRSRLTSLAAPAADTDAAVVRFFDELYLEGKVASMGEKLLAAIFMHVPDYQSKGKLALPRAYRALRGWRLLRPSRTRRPLPWAACMGVARQIWRISCRPDLAVFWLLMVDTYLRHGEAFRLTCGQVIPPQAHMPEVTIHINPDYMKRPSKTGEMDETVDVARPWLGSLLVRLAQGPPSASLWTFAMTEAKDVFERATRALGLDKQLPVLYTARHSGASIDRFTG